VDEEVEIIQAMAGDPAYRVMTFDILFDKMFLIKISQRICKLVAYFL
jgi:hypothetical protein